LREAWTLPDEFAVYSDTVTGTADESTNGDDTDFWLAIPGFRESLVEAEADYAAGRTFGEEEIRARFGLSPGTRDGSADPAIFDRAAKDRETVQHTRLARLQPFGG